MKRGFAAFRHGSGSTAGVAGLSPRQSWLERTKMFAAALSVGACAKKLMLAPALRVLKTNEPIRPLNVPVWTAPWSTPTTT